MEEVIKKDEGNIRTAIFRFHNLGIVNVRLKKAYAACPPYRAITISKLIDCGKLFKLRKFQHVGKMGCCFVVRV